MLFWSSNQAYIRNRVFHTEQIKARLGMDYTTAERSLIPTVSLSVLKSGRSNKYREGHAERNN